MDIEEIKKRVAQIKRMKADDEAAHSAEDQLRADFIAYVASLEMLPSLSEKAKLVMTTEKINFARWCA